MKPTKDFSTRFKTAKEYRDGIRPLIEAQFMFTCPAREHDFNRFEGTTKSVAETQVYVSIGEDCAIDLAGDLVTYYTPAEVKWSEYLVVMDIPEDAADEVLEVVQSREDTLWDVIQSSNYNDIAPRLFFEAATHGTPALWVCASHIAQPIHFEVVPPEQLYITPGHNGYLDRFRRVRVYAETLPALFNGWDVSLTDPAIKQKIEKAALMCEVIWGFWLDWTDMGNPQWRCEITVDGKRVTPETPLSLGPMAGSCPLLVGRFNPQTNHPWGRGAGIKALPDLRVLDKVSETVLSAMDQSLLTTLIYADDGHIDFSDGIEAGRAYPAHRGFTRDSIVDLGRTVNVDQGWFAEERI
ncbi:MAG: portal protein, partial [Paracoccaceae bacterium]